MYLLLSSEHIGLIITIGNIIIIIINIYRHWYQALI